MNSAVGDNTPFDGQTDDELRAQVLRESGGDETTRPAGLAEEVTTTEKLFIAWLRSLDDRARAIINNLLVVGRGYSVARLMLLAFEEDSDKLFEVRSTKGR